MHHGTKGSPGTSTLANLLAERAQQYPDFNIYKWLSDGECESAALSYAELDRRAQAIAAELRSLETKPAVALLLYRPGLEFVEGELVPFGGKRAGQKT